MTTISGDAETHSHADLGQCGANAYVLHPSTDCLCFAYHEVGAEGGASLWRRGEPCPADLRRNVAQGAKFSGWNVIGFDRLVWNHILVPRHGFPPLPDDSWVDTMHLAAAANLPRSLDGCASAVGFPFEKNLKDQARLRRITNANKTPVPSQEDLDWLEARCRQDVMMEEGVMLALPAWPTVEPWRFMPAIDRRINDRGVLLDRTLVQGMARAARDETHRLNGIMAKITDGKVNAVTQVEALKEWLVGRGVPVPRTDGQMQADLDPFDADDADDEDNPGSKKSPWKLRKSDIADLLADPNMDPTAREALAMRAEAGKASVRKLNTMLLYADASGRLKGILKLMGAQQTARWSSGGPQFHNLVRDTFANPDEIAEANGLSTKKDAARVAQLQATALLTAIEVGRGGDADMIRFLYERVVKDAQGRPSTAGVLTWISRMGRRTIAAPEGKLLLNGDFSSAQARITAWLSQQVHMLRAYANNEDTYKVTAAGMYQTTIELITKMQRQSGKVAILAGGFGGGPKALIAMAYAYGMLLGMNEATAIIASWRKNNPDTEAYWYATDDAAAAAVLNPGQEFPVAPCGLVSYFMNPEGTALCCRLPSGRLLRYWRPQLHQEYWSNGRPKDRLSLTYLTVKGHAVFRTSLYHTILVNNQVQGIEADMLGVTLKNLEDADLSVVLHVHDNAVPEVDEDKAEFLLPIMKQCMLAQPAWSYGLPIAAEVEISSRFG